MKAIYFYDMLGDPEKELFDIKYILSKRGIPEFDIELAEYCPLDKKFDILFFDYGGMSVGNSMLQSLCGHIIKHAEENPSRIYVMTSDMTEYAMWDLIKDYPDRPFNIYVKIEFAVESIKEKIGI